MDLSIIIVSYNTHSVTKDCLQSIQDSTLQLNYEVIVVDNASSDGTVEMVKQEFPETILIPNNTNNMFAKANNQGMKIAKGDYFLLLNSDTIVSPGNIERIYRFISSNYPPIGCVGPRVLNLDGTIQREDNPLLSISNAITDVLNPLIRGLPRSIFERLIPPGNKLSDKSAPRRRSGWISGACMMVASDAAKMIGGFDENYFFYGEEVDFCQRLKKAGYETWVVTGAEIIHLNGASTVSNSKKKHDNIINGRARFCRKHFSKPASLLYLYIYITGYRFSYFLSKDKTWKKNCLWWVDYYRQILNRI